MLVLGGNYVKENINQLNSINVEKPYLILSIIVLLIFQSLIVSLQNKNMLKSLNTLISHKESFQLSIITSFYNVITPFRGGMVARAAYLKRKHNFSYTNFISTLGGTYVLMFLSAGILGLFSFLFVAFHLVLFLIFLFITLGMLFLIGGFPLIMKFKKYFKNRYLMKIFQVLEGWKIIKQDKVIVTKLLFLTIAQIITVALMQLFQFKVFGVDLSIGQALILACLNVVAIVIQITPAGLGVNEAITVFTASTFGITPAVSLSASILGRIVSFAVLIILGPIFSYKLLRTKK